MEETIRFLLEKFEEIMQKILKNSNREINFNVAQRAAVIFRYADGDLNFFFDK